jgi:hypothetical protein
MNNKIYALHELQSTKDLFQIKSKEMDYINNEIQIIHNYIDFINTQNGEFTITIKNVVHIVLCYQDRKNLLFKFNEELINMESKYKLCKFQYDEIPGLIKHRFNRLYEIENTIRFYNL